MQIDRKKYWWLHRDNFTFLNGRKFILGKPRLLFLVFSLLVTRSSRWHWDWEEIQEVVKSTWFGDWGWLLGSFWSSLLVWRRERKGSQKPKCQQGVKRGKGKREWRLNIGLQLNYFNKLLYPLLPFLYQHLPQSLQRKLTDEKWTNFKSLLLLF